jgi:hypothetical protein
MVTKSWGSREKEGGKVGPWVIIKSQPDRSSRLWVVMQVGGYR